MTQGAPFDPQERRIRRSWWLFGAALAALAILVVVLLVTGHGRPVDYAVAGLVILVGLAAARHRLEVQALEADRRAEAESFARILQGLSRSVSPDAIVDAIIEELASGTQADHIVVARRRPDGSALVATLVSRRPGVPSSTTLLPIADLDDEAWPGAARDERASIAIPIEAGAAAVPVAAGVGGSGGPFGALADPGLAGVFAGGAFSRTEPSVGGSGGRMPAGRTGDLGQRAAQRAADRIAIRVREAYGLKHTLAAPLVTDGVIVGAIVVSRRTAGSWPTAAARILSASAVEASAALARAYSHRAAETRASTDALTGLPNRRYFDEFCGLLSRRRRAEDAVGLLMIDIDRFKALNDRYGHAAGDEVLRHVGRAIARAVREDDVPARYGGEEFAVLLRNPGPGVAIEVGERVRAAVGAIDVASIGVGPVSVSVGVAVGSTPDRPISELLVEADRALYRAKDAGRDRVIA